MASTSTNHAGSRRRRYPACVRAARCAGWAATGRPSSMPVRRSQDGALRRRGRILSGDGTDFSKGFVDAFDHELGAPPAERSAAEAGAQCPGMHQSNLVVRGGRRLVARRRAWLPPSRPGRRQPGVPAAGRVPVPSPLRRYLGLRQCSPHELFVAARRFGIRLAAGVNECTAQLVEDHRAPVQADEPLVVQVDQQAAGGRAEQRVGIGGDREHHGVQRAKISLSRSAPS